MQKYVWGPSRLVHSISWEGKGEKEGVGPGRCRQGGCRPAEGAVGAGAAMTGVVGDMTGVGGAGANCAGPQRRAPEERSSNCGCPVGLARPTAAAAAAAAGVDNGCASRDRMLGSSWPAQVESCFAHDGIWHS